MMCVHKPQRPKESAGSRTKTRALDAHRSRALTNNRPEETEPKKKKKIDDDQDDSGAHIIFGCPAGRGLPSPRGLRGKKPA